jgi:hypothetical protein
MIAPVKTPSSKMRNRNNGMRLESSIGKADCQRFVKPRQAGEVIDDTPLKSQRPL